MRRYNPTILVLNVVHVASGFVRSRKTRTVRFVRTTQARADQAPPTMRFRGANAVARGSQPKVGRWIPIATGPSWIVEGHAVRCPGLGSAGLDRGPSRGNPEIAEFDGGKIVALVAPWSDVGSRLRSGRSGVHGIVLRGAHTAEPSASRPVARVGIGAALACVRLAQRRSVVPICPHLVVGVGGVADSRLGWTESAGTEPGPKVAVTWVRAVPLGNPL